MSDMLAAVTEALKGRYRIERLLGTGGMASVYLAHDERHGRPVAVKVLRPELAVSIGVERFQREIGIAARLNHPHILPLLDSGTLDLGPGQPASAYYVMPFVEGESLRDRLNREKRLEVDVALRYAREVADALDHAHRSGIVHRDIKPENILLSDRHAVVADFGIARALDAAGGATLTHPGMAVGTPAYMSPEQVTGERTVDGRSDLYALASMLFEMITGRPPFTGTMSGVLTRRLAEDAPRIRSLDPAVPPAVDDALARALDRDPLKRFDTPGEFAAMLATGTTTPTVIATIPPRRSLLARAGLGVLGLAALVYVATRMAQTGRAESITSLAVAPETADSATAYLSEGILDAVANLLRRVPQLRVTAPSLVSQVRRQQPGMNAEELGAHLKVAAVLTWSLRREGDSVRLTAELLRVPGGSLVWNARYSRPWKDLASIQGEIARMVSDSLRLQLTGVEYATMERRPTANANAYDMYLRGRRFQLRGTPLGANDALKMLDSSAHYARKAIELDPGFAQAYGLLGTYYFVTAFRGAAPFVEFMDSSQANSARALASDSTVGDPWVSVISKAIYLDDDWTAAIAAADRALRFSVHDSQVLQFVGIVVGEVEGRLDSAIVLLRRSVDLEPNNPNMNTLGDLFLRAGRYDSALVVLRRAFDLDPSVPGPRRRLIESLEHLKRFQEAIAVRQEGGDSAGAAHYARGFKESGAAGYEKVRRDDLTAQLQAQLARASEPFRIPQDTVPKLREERIAELYAQLGEWTKAMDWVEKLMQRRPKRFRLLVTNPQFAGLRNDPRFMPLVEQQGLRPLLP